VLAPYGAPTGGSRWYAGVAVGGVGGVQGRTGDAIEVLTSSHTACKSRDLPVIARFGFLASRLGLSRPGRVWRTSGGIAAARSRPDRVWRDRPDYAQQNSRAA